MIPLFQFVPYADLPVDHSSHDRHALTAAWRERLPWLDVPRLEAPAPAVAAMHARARNAVRVALLRNFVLSLRVRFVAGGRDEGSRR